MIDEKISAVSDLFDDYKYGVESTLQEILSELKKVDFKHESITEAILQTQTLIDDIHLGRI